MKEGNEPIKMLVSTAIRETVLLFTRYRRLYVPFVLALMIELIGVLILWLAPHEPFSAIFAPPIRYFAHEQMLHYPWHLLFIWIQMPALHSVSMILIGSYLSGIATLMVRQAHLGLSVSMRSAFVTHQARYWRLVLIWLAGWGIAQGAMSLLAHLPESQSVRILVSFGAMVLIQALLVYSIPAAVFNGLSWWRAILRSLSFFRSHPLTTLIFVAVPSGMIILYSIALPQSRVWALMQESAPEWVFALIPLRWLVWLLADAFMTVCAAQVWLLADNSPGENSEELGNA